MGTDLLPTMLDELNLPLPPDRMIDGKSLAATLRGGPSPHEVLYHYAAGTLMAVRSATHKYRDRKAVAYPTDPVRLPIWQAHGPWLFDMRADSQEAYDISMKYPALATRMKALLDAKNAEMKKTRAAGKCQTAIKALSLRVIFRLKTPPTGLKITEINRHGQ